MSELPRASRVLLDLVLPSDWRPDIARDLEEAWTVRRTEHGAVRARLWLWGQILSFAVRFAPDRIRDLWARPTATSTDLKLALRAASRAPVMTALGVVSLGVGIGAAVTGYTVLRGGVFATLPFPGGERIVLVSDFDQYNRYAIDLGPAEFLRRRQQLESFEYFEAFQNRYVVVGDAQESATAVTAFYATPGFLDMTGTAPAMGRLPDEGDIRPGAEPVVVLSHSKWSALTGSDPAAVGRQLEIAGVARTVIGVMPEGFGFPWSDDLWIPVDPRDATGPLRVIAKLDPGVSMNAARAELAAVALPDPTQMEPDAEITHVVTSLAAPTVTPAAYFALLIPIGVLLALLVIMAANVANLVLAKNATRHSEISVRRALGGSRRRIVGQLASEVIVMVALAAVAGIAASRALVGLMERTVGAELPIWADFSLRPGAILLAVLLGGLVTLIAGVVPALRATSGPTHALQDAGRGSTGIRFGRLSGALIVVQVTLCVGFLSAATLLGQSLLGYGFDRYGLPLNESLVAQIYFGWPEELRDPDRQLTAEESEEIRLEFMAEATRKRSAIRDAALELPGVTLAAYGSRFPGNESESRLVTVEGEGAGFEVTETADVSESYFSVLGVAPSAGRTFTSEELAGPLPVVLVNESFVRDRLGGANPIGRRVKVAPLTAEDPSSRSWADIIGVVPDIGLNPGNPTNAAALFRPLPDINIMRLVLRGSGNPARWEPQLMDAVRQVDPSIRVQWTRTLAEQLGQPILVFRAVGAGSLVMGLLALLLSAAGIHALTTCAVTNRTRELGIRQALGAGSARIVQVVLRRAGIQLAAGLVLGSGLGYLLLQVAEMWPWEVRQSNPAALILVVVVLLVSGLAALGRPLGRALSIHPADAMRAE